MITFSPHLVATKFPGYYWHVLSHKLYSIKVHGVLHEMKRSEPNYFNKQTEPTYRVSVRGKRRLLLLSELVILVPTDSRIQYEKPHE